MAINEIENLKHLAYKLSTTHCIINGEIWELDKIEQLGCNKFSLQSKLTLPLKLYKYFPNICNVENINYSIESLKIIQYIYKLQIILMMFMILIYTWIILNMSDIG